MLSGFRVCSVPAVASMIRQYSPRKRFPLKRSLMCLLGRQQTKSPPSTVLLEGLTYEVLNVEDVCSGQASMTGFQRKGKPTATRRQTQPVLREGRTLCRPAISVCPTTLRRREWQHRLGIGPQATLLLPTRTRLGGSDSRRGCGCGGSRSRRGRRRGGRWAN